MLNTLKYILTVITLVVLTSCSSPVNQENYSKIQEGMKKSEVINILGKPSESASIGIGDVGGDNLVWKTKNGKISIQFLNNKVVAKSLIKDSSKKQKDSQ